MFHCRFRLNNRPLSQFKIGGASMPAFSGARPHVNDRSKACLQGLGPIPPGSYHIFDRQSGGRLGGLRDLLNGRDDWFSLYANDGLINDETFCQEVERGRFRLHPKGSLGRSEGCVVIDRGSDYVRLRSMLTSVEPAAVPGSRLKAYGLLLVE